MKSKKIACVLWVVVWRLLQICSAIILAGFASCHAVGLLGSDASRARDAASIQCDRRFEIV